MSSGATLLRRVRSLERAFDPPREARVWVIAVEEGEELSDELIAQLGPYDTVLLQEYPRGFLRDEGKSTRGQMMSSWVNIGGGKRKPLVVRQYDVDISKV